MLGFVSRFGSSRGMVRLPNLSGLSRQQAIATIESLGLKFSSSSFSNTTNQALNDTVFEQSAPANVLIDYESEVSISSYVYVPPADVVTYGACQVYSSQFLGTTCSGCTSTSSYIDYYQQAKFVNGVFSGNVFCYSAPYTLTTASSTFCCPVQATCTASTTVHIPWGTCSGGSQSRTLKIVSTDCSVSYENQTRSCCTAGLVSCTSWSGSAGAQSRTCTYRRSDCTTYPVVETRCSSYSSTSCGSCTKKSPFRQTCTTTTQNTDCTTSSTSFTRYC